MDALFDPELLYGTWSLIAASAVDPDGQPLPPPYGPVPMGNLVLAPNGRMMAVLCDGRSDLPEGARRAYASYCGNYRIEGDSLITRVDAAMTPEMVGGDQVRRLAMRGDDLVLFPPRRPRGAQRELVWRRVGPA